MDIVYILFTLYATFSGDSQALLISAQRTWVFSQWYNYRIIERLHSLDEHKNPISRYNFIDHKNSLCPLDECNTLVSRYNHRLQEQVSYDLPALYAPMYRFSLNFILACIILFPLYVFTYTYSSPDNTLEMWHHTFTEFNFYRSILFIRLSLFIFTVFMRAQYIFILLSFVQMHLIFTFFYASGYLHDTRMHYYN